MKFVNVIISNFRNYEYIDVKLDNKNVFFGMNDIGKTNFLYALRFVFDKSIRRNGLQDSDFFKKNVDNPIDIIVSIDISDSDTDADSNKLIASVKGGLLSTHKIVYIKLHAEYNKTEAIAHPKLFWGGDIDNLIEIKSNGTFYTIDEVFNLVYIDAYVDLYYLFKKNASKLIINNDSKDKAILEDINEDAQILNDHISSLSGIQNFQNKINPRFEKYTNKGIEVSIKSEIGVENYSSSVVPYIKEKSTGILYPTSGEGRKKLLSYSLYDLLAEEYSVRKINLFLIEEPENHLHRSLQMALSHLLFEEKLYNYAFLTTHSSYVLSAMNNVNLIRIYNTNKISSSSSIYNVPKKYYQQRNLLNRRLTEALFADKVLLVEGESEEVLFHRILSVNNPTYQLDGVYILPVEGFGFEPYMNILKELNIKFVIKTDNDFRVSDKSKNSFSVLGFYRVNKLVGKKILPTNTIPSPLPIDLMTDNKIIDEKRKLYNSNMIKLDTIRKNHHIYLSKVSLEEDLDEAIHTKMSKYLPKSKGDPINYLKKAKKYHMVEFVEKLTAADCKRIFNNYNFECLKDILK